MLKAFFVLLVFLGCNTNSNVNGTINIKNDILDKEFNSFTVDQVLTNKGLVPYKITLTPGQGIKLPFSKVTQLRFLRKYSDHSKVYIVSCPEKLSEDVLMKLIDVHTNRLSGGCELEKRGVMIKGGFVKWD